MTQYNNINRISIWKNEKRPGKKDADYRIEVNFEGMDFKIMLWKKAEDAHPKAPPWSGSIERAQSISEQAVSKIRKPDPISSGRSLRNDMDDEIPF